jgi:glyceraldehyde 3-phosphate dehydrogenase
MVCLSAVVEKQTTAEAINAAMKEAANGPLKGILGYNEEGLVSSDYIGDTHSSVFDAMQTMVVGGDLVEVQAWYDNEWGFSVRMLDLSGIVASKL